MIDRPNKRRSTGAVGAARLRWNSSQQPLSTDQLIGPYFSNCAWGYHGLAQLAPLRLLVLLPLILLLITVTGCRPGAEPVPIDLEPRAGADPMNAAEAYLQQYQPGPLPRLFQTTHLYDRNGTLLAKLVGEGERTWIPIQQVALELIHATLATEDATFFANSGVDPARIVGALARNVQEGQITSGASTITMQLARNLFLGPEQRYDQSVDRKLLEVGLAQELTALYSKAELLEMYLNLLNYGNLAYGPEAAAQTYFGRSAATLTLAQATYLAGIPQQPANLDPYRNFEATKRRQRIVLDLMVRHGYLTPSAADDAFAAPLDLQDELFQPTTRAPHFVQYVVDHFDRQLGTGYLARAGLQITTTLDLAMQTVAEQVVQEQVALAQPLYDLSNAALVAMRPHSGEILSMVGSVDFADPTIAGQVNVAVRPRQPGSAIKPILYAAALERALVSPATVLWDTPITYTLSGNEIYQPRNYDEQFHGPVTVRTALANSYNIPTVKLLSGLTVETMLETARSLGIESLTQAPEWYGLSLSLGGGEVTLLELTTAFHTLASEGNYLAPQPVAAVADSLGRPLYLLDSATPEPVLSEATAFLVSDILSDAAARTPAFGANSPLSLSRPAASKTGTTNDWRDNWTVGYTRYLVAGVWAGNSDGQPMRNSSGITGAAPIWHEFMEAVLADPALLALIDAPNDPAAWAFTPPAMVVQQPLCPPGVTCRQAGEYFSQAWMDQMGAAGPLADSVALAKSAPVYVQQGESSRHVGFCSSPESIERPVLRLPSDGGIGVAVTGGESTGALPSPRGITPTLSTTVSTRADESPATEPLTRTLQTGTLQTDMLTTAQLQTIGWALQQTTPLHYGPCDQLADIAAAALALQPTAQNSELRLLVDLAAGQRADVPAVASGGSVEVATIAQTDGIPAVDRGSDRYRLAGTVVHDNNCPGQYVMGRVLNSDGAPVAGVWVQMRDQWGNVSTAVSKSGAIDYGLFDFPIPSGSPHELYVTVLEEGGNPASATYPIPHRQGEAGDASCHHIVFQSRR